MPTAQALRLCPDATVVGVPRGAVGRRSLQVREVLEELAPVVQVASVDEFYLDMTGTERALKNESLAETAERIRTTVLDRTAISVSIGGGTRRLIAKLAASRAKPAGVFVVAPGKEQDFLDQLELAQIPGIGPALVDGLRRRGLVHVRDAVAVELEWLQRWFGERRGSWLHRRIRGGDSSRVDPRERRRSISAERTFPGDISEAAELERRLLDLTQSVGATLRGKGLRARTVTVKLRDHDFRTRQHTRTLPEAVESNAAIYQVARSLLEELRRRRHVPARLLGVGLSGWSGDDDPGQLALFEEATSETDRDREVSRAVDRLADRFGFGTVVPGAVLDEPPTRKHRTTNGNDDERR
jgi:DNA polymerase-4